jgi:hypothetical protein
LNWYVAIHWITIIKESGVLKVLIKMAPKRKKDPFSLDFSGSLNFKPPKLNFGFEPPKLDFGKSFRQNPSQNDIGENFYFDPPKLPKFKAEPTGYELPALNLFDPYDDQKKERAPISQKMKHELENRAKNHCEKCGMSFTSIRPDIHHKNHDPSDNRKRNLIILCPNCHRRTHQAK